MQGLMNMEPLGLAYVAAFTPKNWKIDIMDEVMGDDWHNYHPDLVAMTSLTQTAPRAYEIAGYWRAKNIPVILGGIHATTCPDEALSYVDSVFMGEAWGGWANVINDFENGQLKQVYQATEHDLKGLPLPRRDLYKHRYRISLVMASRGCRNRCEFCAIWKSLGGTYRQRPVHEIVAELPQVPKGYLTLFTDDNIYTDRNFALTLFKSIKEKGLKQRFAVQSALDITDDDEVLASLKSSGCLAVQVGLESLNEETLRIMRKGVNLRIGIESYRKKIEKLHSYGLMAAGTFIFGSDGDTFSVFEKTANFVIDAGLDIAHFGLLAPTPGTDVFERFHKEGRLLAVNFPKDYVLYDLAHSVFIPKGMNSFEAEKGLVEAVKKISSWKASAYRAWKTYRYTGNIVASMMAFVWNRSGLANLPSRLNDK